jgi:nucleoside-diphosphate-sugar epimerase
MRVVVTGAGGFIGRTIASKLARAGHDVIAIYRKSRPETIADPKIELLQTDLCRLERLPRVESVVHCAADVPATCPDEQELYRNNVDGTCALFSAAETAGARRIVYLSSMAIYGTISVPVVDENLPPDNPDNYGRSKLEGETMLAAFGMQRADIGALAIRLPGVVGAGARNNFLANTLARLFRGEAIRAQHPDALFNNVVHVHDLAAFVVEHLPLMPPGRATANIAAREPMTVREIVELLHARVGRENEIEWSTDGKQPFTISLLRIERLGYSPRTVRDTLERFAQDEISSRKRPD